MSEAKSAVLKGCTSTYQLFFKIWLADFWQFPNRQSKRDFLQISMHEKSIPSIVCVSLAANKIWFSNSFCSSPTIFSAYIYVSRGSCSFFRCVNTHGKRAPPNLVIFSVMERRGKSFVLSSMKALNNKICLFCSSKVIDFKQTCSTGGSHTPGCDLSVGVLQDGARWPCKARLISQALPKWSWEEPTTSSSIWLKVSST